MFKTLVSSVVPSPSMRLCAGIAISLATLSANAAVIGLSGQAILADQPTFDGQTSVDYTATDGTNSAVLTITAVTGVTPTGGTGPVLNFGTGGTGIAVDDGDGNVSGNQELLAGTSLSFTFDTDVVLYGIDFRGLNDPDSASVTIGASAPIIVTSNFPNEFIAPGLSSPFNKADNFIPDPAISVSAGTTILVSQTVGSAGLTGIAFEIVPEPGSLALLAMGGFAILAPRTSRRVR